MFTAVRFNHSRACVQWPGGLAGQPYPVDRRCNTQSFDSPSASRSRWFSSARRTRARKASSRDASSLTRAADRFRTPRSRSRRSTSGRRRTR